jgi:hypothetical protein
MRRLFVGARIKVKTPWNLDIHGARGVIVNCSVGADYAPWIVKLDNFTCDIPPGTYRFRGKEIERMNGLERAIEIANEI